MTPTQFEDRLLAELRQVVATRPEPAAVSPPRRAPRPRLLAGAATATAAAAAVVAVAASGGGASPAYAVDRQADGSVTVTISSLRDADGLERKLRAAGVPAVVDYTPEGKMCRSPRGKLTRDGKLTIGASVRDDGPASFTVPRDLGAGRTLVIQASVGEHFDGVGVDVVEGAVAPCTLVDAPAPSSEAAPVGSVEAAGGGGSTVKSLHTGP